MSQRKSERIVNLTIMLLGSRQFLTRERIRTTVEGYRDLSDAAFERTFERDKDDLRAMGVPIETGSHESFHGDAVGYRIPRSDFELPAMEFSPAEAAVLGLAAQVWQQASSAESTRMALTKLRAAGVDPDSSRLAALQPVVNAPDPAFEVVKDAFLAQQAVAFRYRGGDEVRTVEPWAMPLRSGAWYLIGFDRGRGERRTFKISRITSAPQLVGKPGAFTVPEQVDTRVAVDDQEQSGQALVAIRGEHAPGLRRRGRAVSADDVPESLAARLPEGFELWWVPYVRTHAMVQELAAAAPHVAVVEPDHLVRAHAEHLQRVLEAHPAQADEGSSS
ncbi:helix-turn-helix transcriptional regulator [Aestuariimicrobium ganziense]|uniref:helix-turn-helix transcriptional regulator n=1 Tax=Aestuariimicrobium ganziense TaxID=2773677 RepID=UPI001945614A|nr:WYL domain-containing protein [Aestuariimicrobium ganziense]